MDQREENPHAVSPRERVTIDKQIVKEALAELLQEIPAFRAFASKDAQPTSGANESETQPGGSTSGSTAQVEPPRTPVNAVGELATVVINYY